MGREFDKRRHERAKYKTPVKTESLQSGINEGARMVNFSNTGIYFETDELFQPGVEIFIGIENSPYSQTAAYECYLAKVKWGKRLKNNPLAYGYGAKYVDIPREKDILKANRVEKNDQRKHPRKLLAKPAIFRFEDKSYDGFIMDISQKGCFIKNRDIFETGQILNLVIPGTKIDEDNMLKVEIVRLSPVGIGVEFKGMLKKKTRE
jgi:hypothetical protein